MARVLVYDDRSALARALSPRWRAQVDADVEVRAEEGGGDGEQGDDARDRTFVRLCDGGDEIHGVRAIFMARADGFARLARRFPGVLLLLDHLLAFGDRYPSIALFLLRALLGADVRPPSHVFVRWIFLRALAVVHLAAFASALVQIVPLVGEHGIAPAKDLLVVAPRIAASHAWSAWHLVPTLFWIAPTDTGLRALCIGGIVASLLLFFDVAPRASLFAAWLLYLSIVSIGGVFFHYQWDALLLEVSLCGLFLAPRRLLPSRDLTIAVPRTGRWLLLLVLFKLMFLSGAVKILSDDPTWKSLRALDYHYFSQPLPAATSWYAQHAPTFVRRASCLAMFGIELAAPFFLFFTRRLRRLAFALFVFLQLGIAATGNYGFFNLLSAVLAIIALDDGAFPRRLRDRFLGDGTIVARPTSRARRIVRVTVGAFVASFGAMQLAMPFVDSPVVAFPLVSLEALESIAPFHSINAYGLFATMTTRRREILIEGSDDGVTWRRYVFRYAPQRPDRAPRFAPLHMPRLDWQMWFAALRRCEDSPWFIAFARRLLEGSPTVTSLLEENPFPDHPPRLLRTRLVDQRFTTPEERAATGAWWVQRDVGTFCPTLTIIGGELAAE